MKKKLLITLILLISSIVLGINNVIAVGFTVADLDIGENEITSTEGLPGGTATTSDGYTCEYKYQVTVTNTVNIDGYNLNDESIMETSIIPSENIKAGTSIGLNIYEHKIATAKVIKAEAYKTVTYCAKSCLPGKVIGGSSNKQQMIPFGSITIYSKTKQLKVATQECPEDGCLKWGSYTTIDKDHKECQQIAQDAASASAKASMGASYTVKFQDSNDINTTQVITTNPKSSCSTPTNCIYSYNISKVCINVKTSKVNYNRDCNENEMEVKGKTGQNGHFHYFIPLNAKSNDTVAVTLGIKGDDAYLRSSMCEYVMNQYSNEYQNLIVASKSSQNPSPDNYITLTGNKTSDKKLISKGCFLRSVIRIPVEQKFYGEETNKKGNTTLKGFNFYYRPIDINNPFPNGIANDSYWKEWADNKKKNPELTKSFDQITYKIDNVNTKEIREYTKNYKYTYWSNMNIDGTSNFVTSYLNRNIKLDTFYKLGCGPANESWEECGR